MNFNENPLIILSLIAGVGLCFHKTLRSCVASRITHVKCGCIDIEQSINSDSSIIELMDVKNEEKTV
jgi:hypothetical protein